MDDLLLYGGPGTGKTHAGLEWLAERVEDGSDLHRVAFNSYTNAAVDEARNRLAERFDVDPDDLPYCRTLHSLAKRTLGVTEQGWNADDHLATFAEEYGYDVAPPKRKPDDDDLETLAERAGRDAPLLRIWDFARHRLITDPEDGWREFIQYDPVGVMFSTLPRFAAFVTDYERWKRESALRDYTDLLLEYLEEPVALPVSVAVVDEYQDLSPLLGKVADALFSGAEFRATLGDDDQALYSFSGAAPELMNRRACREKRKLEQSRRCPRKITETALSIISQNDNREPKRLLPREVDGVADRANRLEELPLNNGETWFGLVRNWRLLEQVTPWLEEHGVPYLIGGSKRYSPWNDRGPLRAVRTILQLAAGQTVRLNALLPVVERTGTQRGEKAGAWAWGAKKKLEELALKDGERPVNWRNLLELGMTVWGFQKVMRQDLSVLTREISERDLRTYQQAQERGTLFEPVRVVLSSIHGSKGQERDNVFALMACTGGPARAMLYPWRIEEERRVAYVACTRARKRFYGLMAQPAPGVHPWELLEV